MSQIAYFISHRYINLLEDMTIYLTIIIMTIILMNRPCNLMEAIFSEFIDFEIFTEKKPSNLLHIARPCNYIVDHVDFHGITWIYFLMLTMKYSHNYYGDADEDSKIIDHVRVRSCPSSRFQ